VSAASAVALEAQVRRRRRRRTGAQIFKYAALAFAAIVVLLPVYVLLVASFKSGTEADPSRAWALPQVWSVDAWREAWNGDQYGLLPFLKNSLKLVIPATLISTILGSLNGFVLSRWRFPGSEIVFLFLLFGMFIPYQAVMIPLSQIFIDAHFPDGLPRLVFAHIVYGIPITTLIFRSYYATIPNDLIEAARMDRAGMLRTYWSVVLPISAPAFVVTAIWQFTSIWNDFLFAVFLITNPSSWPVTVALNNTTGSLVTPYNVQMAAALIASLPTLIVYILLGRYFMRGLMAGALKG
jgi:glucose/mannose transport system permease protein